jgi:hypothetical protein
VPVTKEGNSAEHLPFRDRSIAGKRITDALGKLFAVRHGSTLRTNGRDHRPAQAGDAR